MDHVATVLDGLTQANLGRLSPEAERLWRLQATPDSAAIRTSLADLGARVERAKAAIAALDETEELGEANRAVARIAQRRALMGYDEEASRLRAQLERSRERDTLQEGRPDGCFCLGLGGGGRLILVDGAPAWQRWCVCPEAQAQLAAADQAAESARAAESAAREAEEARRRADAQEDRIRRANLPARLAGFAWDAFEREPEKRSVVATLRRLVAGEWSGRVLLFGDFGTGKSTLAYLALCEWITAGGSGLFVTLADYLEALRPADGRTMPLDAVQRKMALGSGLLVLDDVGAERLTAWGRDAAFRLVNTRCDAKLPTIVTSNYEPGELALRLAGEDDVREGQRIVERIVEPPSDLVRLLGRNYRRPKGT